MRNCLYEITNRIGNDNTLITGAGETTEIVVANTLYANRLLRTSTPMCIKTSGCFIGNNSIKVLFKFILLHYSQLVLPQWRHAL